MVCARIEAGDVTILTDSLAEEVTESSPTQTCGERAEALALGLGGSVAQKKMNAEEVCRHLVW